jgi:hypothetical protein
MRNCLIILLWTINYNYYQTTEHIYKINVIRKTALVFNLWLIKQKLRGWSNVKKVLIFKENFK